MPTKILRKEGSFLKDLPAGLTRPENGDWVCMSAEIPAEDEHGGDIVRVEGMEVPKGIPLQAQHMRYAPDGSPTTIGRIEESVNSKVEWKGQMVPAKLGRFEWASTDLSAKYKQLWPKFLNKVSVGAFILDGEPLDAKKPFGGYDYKKSELFELSIVTFPANPAAGVVRTITQTLGLEEGESLAPHLEKINGLLAEIADSLNKKHKRLDKIEALLTARLPDAAEQESDHNPQVASEDLSPLAKALKDALKSLK